MENIGNYLLNEDLQTFSYSQPSNYFEKQEFMRAVTRLEHFIDEMPIVFNNTNSMYEKEKYFAMRAIEELKIFANRHFCAESQHAKK